MSRTPGNWHQDGLKIIGNGYAIATVNSHKTTEGAANASMIAAAPEMLEALQKISVLASSYAESSKARTEKIGAIARSTIAKALGE